MLTGHGLLDPLIGALFGGVAVLDPETALGGFRIFLKMGRWILPVMIYYFGVELVTVLTVYMILFSIINGCVVERLQRRTKGEASDDEEAGSEDSHSG